MEGRRGELRIDGRQRCALSPGECLDLTPALRDPFIERKEPARKANPQVMIEPALQRSSLRFIFIEQVDPFANLSDVITLRCISSSGVATIHAATERDGLGFISSEMTFVSSR
jgi:hypothetical protein